MCGTVVCYALFLSLLLLQFTLGKATFNQFGGANFTYFALQRLKGLGISGDFGEICGVKFMISTVPLAMTPPISRILIG